MRRALLAVLLATVLMGGCIKPPRGCVAMNICHPVAPGGGL